MAAGAISDAMNITRCRQTIAREYMRTPCLPGSVVSPYMHMTDASMTDPGRYIRVNPKIMTLTAKIAGYTAAASSVNVQVFLESSDATINVGTVLSLPTAYADTDVTIEAAVATAINNLCSSISLPNPSTIDWLFSTPGDVAAAIAAIPAPAVPLASALSLSLQTSTGAVGTQISATRNAYVMLNGNVSTTSTIGGASAGDIILEVAPTNSATAGDWIEWGRIGNSQTITLALALNSVQITKGMAVAFVPAGYYMKARQAGSGTVSYTLTNAKQILI